MGKKLVQPASILEYPAKLFMVLLWEILSEDNEVGTEGDSGVDCFGTKPNFADSVVQIPCRQAHRCDL
jgi:hypothetical protein